MANSIKLPTVIEVVKTTSAAVGVASVLLVPENPLRLGFSIWNNVGNTRYVTFGATSSSASPTFIIGSFTHFIWPYENHFYIGPISAIGNAGSGVMVVYEFQQRLL